MAEITFQNKLYNTSSKSMRLNESLSTSDKYILEGVFAELGVMNNNHRIYTENEYLKHLSYLREDVKRGDLLGELDHPDDRYETKLKEVSHRVIDIWYDQPSKMIMGKIELADTPNGKLAKSLLDMGVPLHISSRAAGTINKDNTVSIQQIYTYDLVAKPGFAKATLHRVNESASQSKYSGDALNFLKHSEATEERNTLVSNLINEGFYTDDKKLPTSFRKEAIQLMENKDYKIDMDEISKHINEESESQPDNSEKSAAAAGVPTADMTLEATDDDDKEDKKSEKDDSSKDDKDTKEDTNKEDKKSDDDKEDDYEIIDVKAYEEPEDDKKDDDGDDDEKTDDEDEKSEKSEEDNKKEEDNKSESKEEKEPTEANKLFDKKNELEMRTKKFDEKFDELLNRLKTKKAVTESEKTSLNGAYPFTAYMDDKSVSEFSKLDESKKEKVKNYLCESSIVNTDRINDLWRNGLNENATKEPIWLAEASEDYRNLYYATTDAKREELHECAKFIKFETKADIDAFWRNSELKTMQERQMMLESFTNSLPNISVKKANNDLPYSMENVMRNVAYVMEK